QAVRAKQVSEITGLGELGWQYHLGIAPCIRGNLRYLLVAKQLRCESRNNRDQPFILIMTCKSDDLLRALSFDLQRLIITFGKQLGMRLACSQSAGNQMLLDTPVAPVFE